MLGMVRNWCDALATMLSARDRSGPVFNVEAGLTRFHSLLHAVPDVGPFVQFNRDT
jgi:hypothetical protein